MGPVGSTPTDVINTALVAAKPALTKAGDTMASVLVDFLSGDPHYAQFEICVTAEIIDPVSGDVVGKMEHKEPYQIYPARNPDCLGNTE